MRIRTTRSSRRRVCLVRPRCPCRILRLGCRDRLVCVALSLRVPIGCGIPDCCYVLPRNVWLEDDEYGEH